MKLDGPVSGCCGYIGVVIGMVRVYLEDRPNGVHALLSMQLVCPQCGACIEFKSDTMLDQSSTGMLGVHQAFAVYDAEQVLKCV